MAGSHQRVPQGKFATDPSKHYHTNNHQEEGVNPIYGISSEGYSGKGFVQSKSAKAQGITIESEDDM